jgi:thymidylate synthase (FAD)
MDSYQKKIELYGDGIGSVEYVQHMGDDLTVVNSARVSFGVHKHKLDEKDKKLINYLIKHKHTSTLEHNQVTFRFKVPLFIRSQHHRHRTWSYNEVSRRYTDVGIQFYEPETFRTQHKTNRQASNFDNQVNPILSCGSDCDESVKLHHYMSVELYNKMLKAGVCREQARGVLPQNLYTEYYGSCNLSNLLKFVDLRTHSGAQYEIQLVAEACLEIACDLYPATVSAYQKIKNL